MEEGPFWDARVQQLLQDGIISGYALLSKSGSTQAAAGVLSKAYRSAGAGTPADSPLQMHQFVDAFSHSRAPPLAFRLAGQNAVVFRRTDCDILAISHRRQLGLCIHALPFGILVCTYSRQKLPQEVVPRVLRVCDVLRG